MSAPSMIFTSKPKPLLVAAFLFALVQSACVSPSTQRVPPAGDRLEALLDGSSALSRERLARELRSLSLNSPRHVPTLIADAALSFETGRTARARALLDAALEYEPGDVDATVLAVQVAATSGDLAGASRRIESALVLRPDEPLLHESSAAIAFLGGEFEDAREALDRADLLEGGESWSRAYHRGLIAEAEGQFGVAEDAFERCRELAPDFEEAKRRQRGLVVKRGF